MKKIGDLALVAIAVILLVGLFMLKDYRRYELYADGVMLDTRTGHVWSIRTNSLRFTPEDSN